MYQPFFFFVITTPAPAIAITANAAAAAPVDGFEVVLEEAAFELLDEAFDEDAADDVSVDEAAEFDESAVLLDSELSDELTDDEDVSGCDELGSSGSLSVTAGIS